MKPFILTLLILSSLSSCSLPKVPFHPHFCNTPPAHCLQHNPSPFEPLSLQEKSQEFSKELLIGEVFAKECDFYRAITCFKRALILLSCENFYRRLQLEYDILLSYYLGERYEEVLETFENSCLKSKISKEFPALHDLLVILYDSCKKTNNLEKSAPLLHWLETIYPTTSCKIRISEAVESGHLKEAATLPSAPPYFCKLYDCYLKDTKSKRYAERLNALLPGAGYWYVGQKNTAITALIVNALFIAASYQFFHRGYMAAGIITASLEAGWYMGGIYGAGRAACEYNEHRYEEYGKKALDESGLYPILMLKYVF